MIPFNKPYITGNEKNYIEEVITSRNLASNGKYTAKCERFFEERYGFNRALLTTSCTSALELAALLIDIHPGDEIIVPSYTYVTTASVFEKFGANVVFVDSCEEFPNLDPELLESLISEKTKAIVSMHYAGVSCEMDRIMEIANKHKLFVIEDAAMAIEGSYKDRYLGSIGHFAAFSFHETKNISCGEGGLLVVNDPKFIERAEILREKGTNRQLFLKGKIDKYEWVDLGGSFAPNEITAAFLFAQLEQIDEIQEKRKLIWKDYENELNKYNIKDFEFPKLPANTNINGHSFFAICKSKEQRNNFIRIMADKGIHLSFHYQTLHQSRYIKNKSNSISLPNAERFSNCLLRFPFFTDLNSEEVKIICWELNQAFRNSN